MNLGGVDRRSFSIKSRSVARDDSNWNERNSLLLLNVRKVDFMVQLSLWRVHSVQDGMHRQIRSSFAIKLFVRLGISSSAGTEVFIHCHLNSNGDKNALENKYWYPRKLLHILGVQVNVISLSICVSCSNKCIYCQPYYAELMLIWEIQIFSSNSKVFAYNFFLIPGLLDSGSHTTFHLDAMNIN